MKLNTIGYLHYSLLRDHDTWSVVWRIFVRFEIICLIRITFIFIIDIIEKVFITVRIAIFIVDVLHNLS